MGSARTNQSAGLVVIVVIDIHYARSDAFKNGYTPTHYVVDAKLRIRRHFLGEQGYDDAELVIRQLLIDAHPKGWLVPVRREDAPLPSVIQSE